jgi:glutaredoxin
MGRSYAFLVLALAVAGLSATQAAPLYKWVDSQGRVSYHDKPPPEDSGYRVEKKNLGPGGESEVDDALEKIVEQYPVVLYSVPVCGSCDLARIYLEKRKVPFTEKNIENNPELQQELKKKAGSLSAPTIMVGEKVMNGYLESLLGGELDAAGYPKIWAPAAAVAVDEDESEDKDKQDASVPDADDQPAQQ